MHQNGLGPAVAGTKNITVGETTAGSKTSESLQGKTAKDIRHVNINCIEASSSESESHLSVTVDTLLSKNGNPRLLDKALEAGHSWQADISRVKLQLVMQTRILVVLNGLELGVGTVGVVSQLLHLVRSAGPPLLDLGALQVDNRLGSVLDQKRLLAGRADVTDSLDQTVRRTTCGEASLESGLFTPADLENSTQLLVEQGIEHLVLRLSKVIQ